MIRLLKLNGSDFVLNAELIETIETTPDTIITTINGKKLVVKDTIEEVIEKVIEYKKKIQFINRLEE
jgi:flagellar protein FlbD